MEGTLIHGVAAVFAGCLRSVGLGRSVSSVVGLVPLQTIAPATAGVLWEKEEGNLVGVAQCARTLRESPLKRRSPQRGQVLRSAQRPVQASLEIAQAIARARSSCSRKRSSRKRRSQKRIRRRRRSIRYRARANLLQCGRNRERGLNRTDGLCGSPRVTASRALERAFARASVTRQKRRKVMVFFPARNREPRSVLVRRRQLQKSTSRVLASNKPVRSAPKR